MISGSFWNRRPGAPVPLSAMGANVSKLVPVGSTSVPPFRGFGVKVFEMRVVRGILEIVIQRDAVLELQAFKARDRSRLDGLLCGSYPEFRSVSAPLFGVCSYGHQRCENCSEFANACHLCSRPCAASQAKRVLHFARDGRVNSAST